MVWTQGQKAPWIPGTMPYAFAEFPCALYLEISWYDLVTQIIKMLGEIAYEPTQFPHYSNMILLFTNRG